MNFFTPNRIQKVKVLVKNKIGKNMEDFYTFTADMQVVENFK